jgi:hypothetical protein
MKGVRIVASLRRSPKRKKRKRLWTPRRHWKRVSAHKFLSSILRGQVLWAILGNKAGQRWGDMKPLIRDVASVHDLDDPKDPWASEAERSVMLQVWMTRIYRQLLWAVEGCGSVKRCSSWCIRDARHLNRQCLWFELRHPSGIGMPWPARFRSLVYLYVPILVGGPPFGLSGSSIQIW